MEEIKCVIQVGKEELSTYMTSILKIEHRHHLSNMEIVSSKDNVSNPFHGILQSSKASHFVSMSINSMKICYLV